MTAPSPATTKVMKANRSKDTGPEVRLRQLIRQSGITGYRKNYPGLPGKPDVYFSKTGVAVYIHGCFWHRCPHCKPNLPKSNIDFWEAKFNANRSRDTRVKSELRKMGVSSVTIWECQLKRKPTYCIGRIKSNLKKKSK